MTGKQQYNEIMKEINKKRADYCRRGLNYDKWLIDHLPKEVGNEKLQQKRNDLMNNLALSFITFFDSIKN